MAGNELNNVIRVKTTYSFEEAIEYLKIRGKSPTNVEDPIRWKNVNTGKEVIIGYTYSK